MSARDGSQPEADRLLVGAKNSGGKKVLLVTRPIAPPWDEGSKNFAYFLAKNISDLEIGLLTNGILSDLPKNVHQKSIYTSNDFSYLQKMRLLKHLRKMRNEFDILHYLFTPTKQNSFLVKNFINSKTRKFRTIQTVATLREDLYSDAEIKDMLFGDLIITYSDHAKNKLAELGFKNVKRVYPGIDIELYRNKGKNPEYLKKYNFTVSDFIINFSGEYVRNGAMDIVLQSFMEISKIIPEVRLSLALRIKNKQDARKKKEVIEVLKKNNLLEKVAFHDDAQYKIFELYNMCDISIFPVSDMHGKFDVPLAVIETMACEKPVIISDIPILREFAKDDNSVRIEKGNTQKLNEAILDLYHNQEKRVLLGQNARKFAEENFDIRKISRIYSEIYKIL
jgi:phosphatidylinositol alpha-1,6-mannosyltransferase